MRLDRRAVLAVFGRCVGGAPLLQCSGDRMCEDECVLADHAQKAWPRISAHLAKAFGERFPQSDDVGSRPVGEPGAKAAMLLSDANHCGGVIADRFELAPVTDQP